jgi:hypothetical protein
MGWDNYPKEFTMPKPTAKIGDVFRVLGDHHPFADAVVVDVKGEFITLARPYVYASCNPRIQLDRCELIHRVPESLWSKYRKVGEGFYEELVVRFPV